MFSQYSWWDFIKFVLVLAVPYYAFVLWKYYREDIREWISNRGNSDPSQLKPSPNADEADEEEISPTIFTVKDYTKSAPVKPAVAQQVEPAQWLSEPQPPVQAGVGLMPKVNPTPEPVQEEVELQGPPVETDTDVVYSLPLMLSVDSPSEQSVDEIAQLVNRLSPDEQGKLSPVDAEDKPAARLAQIINQQQENALSNFAFNR